MIKQLIVNARSKTTFIILSQLYSYNEMKKV